MIASHVTLGPGLTRILRRLTPPVNAMGTAISLALAALIRCGRAFYEQALALYWRELIWTVLPR